MPNVRPGNQVTRNGQHNKSDIMKTSRPEIARDDLQEAFAGDENNGPAANSKTDFEHSTHYKSRKSKHSKEKEPIR